MAKRRSETGKTGKYKHGEYDYRYDRGRTGRNRTMIIVLVLIVVTVVVIASVAFLFLGGEDDSEKEEVSLTTAAPHQGGYPHENFTFDYTIHNPGNEPDIFSPMVSGLPSFWDIIIPATIPVEAEESKDEQIIISPPDNAVNGSYPFTLEVTSAETQRTYTLEYELVIFHAYGIEMICYNNSHDADPGNFTHYGLIITNPSNGDDTISLSYVESYLPAGWTVGFEYESITIPFYDTRVVRVFISTSRATSKGRYDILVTATSSGGPSASTWLNTSLVKDFGNRTIEVGDKVMTNYIGYYIDGLIFDTSLEEVATNANYSREPNVEQKTFFSPLGMYVGGTDPDTTDAYGKMVDGYWEASIGMKANETKVVRLPPEKTYNDGKVRLFEITIVSIDG